MKKSLFLTVLLLALFSCGKSPETGPNESPTGGSGGSGGGSSSGCGSYNGHSLQLGSGGGCYYINSSGNKVYVDRSKCNC